MRRVAPGSDPSLSSNKTAPFNQGAPPELLNLYCLYLLGSLFHAIAYPKSCLPCHCKQLKDIEGIDDIEGAKFKCIRAEAGVWPGLARRRQSQILSSPPPSSCCRAGDIAKAQPGSREGSHLLISSSEGAHTVVRGRASM